MKRLYSLMLAGAVICGSSAAATAATRYVKVSGAGAQDCSTWNNACTLTTALTTAASGDEIWVAAGTYAASGGPFALVDGVKMIGGFAGSESAASQSDPAVNQTVLDGAGANRVLTSSGNSSATVVRGFRITGGYDASSIVVAGGGGAALLQDSQALFAQCVFDANTSTSWGGAIAVRGAASPAFVNCTFSQNGAVVIGAGPDPTTPLAGGAVFVDNGSPSFVNCLFLDNTGMEGGAIASLTGQPTATNCTFVDNTATVGRGGALNVPATVSNSILWGNTAVRGGDQAVDAAITTSDVQGGYSGTGNIDADPLFASPGAGDYRLGTGSPCVAVGDNQFVPADAADVDWDGDVTELVPFGLDGAPRVTGVVDMGAYEAPCGAGSACGAGELCCSGVCQECCVDADCPGMKVCCAQRGYVCSWSVQCGGGGGGTGSQ